MLDHYKSRTAHALGGLIRSSERAGRVKNETRRPFEVAEKVSEEAGMAYKSHGRA